MRTATARPLVWLVLLASFLQLATDIVAVSTVNYDNSPYDSCRSEFLKRCMVSSPSKQCYGFFNCTAWTSPPCGAQACLDSALANCTQRHVSAVNMLALSTFLRCVNTPLMERPSVTVETALLETASRASLRARKAGHQKSLNSVSSLDLLRQMQQHQHLHRSHLRSKTHLDPASLVKAPLAALGNLAKSAGMTIGKPIARGLGTAIATTATAVKPIAAAVGKHLIGEAQQSADYFFGLGTTADGTKHSCGSDINQHAVSCVSHAPPCVASCVMRGCRCPHHR